MTEKVMIGVDIGGTTTKIAYIDIKGKIVEKWEIPTDLSSSGKNIVPNITKEIKCKLDDLEKNKEKILGIGVGAPGPVNTIDGTVLEAINLGWKGKYRLKDELELGTSIPVIVDNDANCAALGEMWQGAGKGGKDLVCVTLGTGVGGGVIANGDIVQGMNGAAGEIGHISSMLEGGAACNCGKRGCLETLASATGIVRLAHEQLKNTEKQSGKLYSRYVANGQVNAKDVFDTAREGDHVSIKIIETVTYYLGVALANVANILNPEKIIIGGGVSKAGETLLKPLSKEFINHCFSRGANSTKLALAALGNDAGVIGAAWLVKNKLNRFDS
ncbi:ROK family glucokinase [Bacillus sp. B15-48]|uniref:ROK family glucokinase n=1 Tax=Bacillus sp. B15-48 TaxID=1548601 RepID=UPI00193EFD6F|nr:ROK family glucokinase [Bacillus sp. B15-48]MBM4762287.1 ROK family glucokinase [Bacillus sp. B15-48]